MESGNPGNLEDMPIHSRGTYQLAGELQEEALEVEEIGPLHTRMVSKNWKTRSKAYQEILEEIKTQRNFAIYADKITKFLNDPNPNPQEKALEILKFYIDSDMTSLQSYCENIVKVLIEKHISGPRNVIKEQSKDLLSKIFILDKEKIIQELSKYCDHKNIKYQAAAISGLSHLITTVGLKEFDFKFVMKNMEKAADNTNLSIRSEALNFYKELYKILKDGINPYIANLKKSQQEELTKAFSTIQVVEEPDVNPYEFLDFKDIFTEFNERWADNVLALEKWSDKKLALEDVNKAADFPKLAEKSSGHLIGMVKRLLNDSNIHVVSQAIKLLGLLAKGQRKYFESYSKMMLPVLLSKFRDKKPLIIQETHTTLDNFSFSLSSDSMIPSIDHAMQDKTVSVKQNTLIWLQKLILSNQFNEDSRKQVVNILKVAIDDSTESIRESTYELLKILIEKHPGLIDCLSGIAENKLKKIKNSKTKTEIPEKSVKNSPKAHKTPLKIKNSPRETKKMDIDQPGKPLPKKQIPNEEPDLNGEIAEEGIIPNEIYTKLIEKAWKTKETGLQLLKEYITHNIPPQMLIKIHIIIVHVLGGFKENNPNLIREGLECLKKIYGLCMVPDEVGSGIISSAALDKLAENKVADLYKQCVLAICEILSPDVVTKKIIANLQSVTKPKTLSESLEFLGIITKEFGPSYVSFKTLADYGKVSLGNTNPLIKKSAVSLIRTLLLFKGEAIFDMLDGVKDSIISSLKDDYKKMDLTSMPKEFRKLKCLIQNPQTNDIVKKANISNLITSSLIASLSDNNWKVRKETLEKIETIIKKSIAPTGLADLVRQLKNRLLDANKTIVKLALTVIGKIAEGLGSECLGFSKIIIPTVLGNLADKQNILRQEAKCALDKWGKNAGYEHIINLSGSVLCQESPEIRQELLVLIINNRESLRKSDIKSLLPGIISCLQDKASVIRTQSEMILGDIIEISGYETVAPFLKDLKPAILQSIQAICNKYMNVAVKAGKAKAGIKNVMVKNNSPFNFQISSKEKRGKSEGIKWIYEEIRQDQIDIIKSEIKNSASEELENLMFNNDFKKKIQACDVIKGMIGAENFAESVEVIFKWAFIEVNGNNSQVGKSVLELILSIVMFIKEKSLLITELEAEILVPTLCEKLSGSSVYKPIAIKLLHEICCVHPSEKCYSLIICGLNSKSCCKSECLAVFCEIYLHHQGPMSAKDITALCKYNKVPDNLTRTLVLKLLSLVYKGMGQKAKDIIIQNNAKLFETISQHFSGQELPILSMQKSFIDNVIEGLNCDDINLKLDALECIDRNIIQNFEQYETEFIRYAFELAEAICKTSRAMYSYPFLGVERKFILFFLSVVTNIFKITNLLRTVDEKCIQSFYEEFIFRASGIENDQEHLNEITRVIIALIEHTDVNKSISCLLNIMIINKGEKRQLQIASKCMLKINRILSEFSPRPDKIISLIHDFNSRELVDIYNPSIRVVRSLLLELVFIVGDEEIWKYYSLALDGHQHTDEYIKNWINDIIKVSYPIIKIFKNLSNPMLHDDALQDFISYMKEHRNENLAHVYKRFPDVAVKLQDDLARKAQSSKESKKDISSFVFEMENPWMRNDDTQDIREICSKISMEMQNTAKGQQFRYK